MQTTQCCSAVQAGRHSQMHSLNVLDTTRSVMRTGNPRRDCSCLTSCLRRCPEKAFAVHIVDHKGAEKGAASQPASQPASQTGDSRLKARRRGDACVSLLADAQCGELRQQLGSYKAHLVAVVC